MATDIDNFYSWLASFNEDELRAEVQRLQHQQEQIGRELGRRLDVLELLDRHRQDRQHSGRLGGQRDISERLRHQPVSPPNGGRGEEESPRGVEAVRRVMREGGVWTFPTLLKELQARGWVNEDTQHPLKATETAVSRLRNKYGEVERVGRGKYRYKGAPDDPNLLTSGEGITP